MSTETGEENILRFFDQRVGRTMVTIQPGELYASSEDELIFTVLGSCVSLCLFDEDRKVGGMNHYKLAGRPLGRDKDTERSGVYGDDALAMLLEAVLRKGARQTGLKAKIYGGAYVTGSIVPMSFSGDNIALARRFLRENGIPLVSENTGGNASRRLVFHPRSGMVLVQLTDRSDGVFSKISTAAPDAVLFEQKSD